ncbi:hypothetical protein LXA43DRAFT_1185600 [Ganoderma leucocontextum]|nr:hypothetical protein LXA43DRAFT_1185600 [Ganoderma leucocontextum]
MKHVPPPSLALEADVRSAAEPSKVYLHTLAKNLLSMRWTTQFCDTTNDDADCRTAGRPPHPTRAFTDVHAVKNYPIGVSSNPRLLATLVRHSDDPTFHPPKGSLDPGQPAVSPRS